MSGDWSAWRWDTPTMLWLSWIAWFVVLESWALASGQFMHTLTWHVRPFLLAHPLLWCLAAGFICWLALHFLAPAWERSLLELLKG